MWLRKVYRHAFPASFTDQQRLKEPKGIKRH